MQTFSEGDKVRVFDRATARWINAEVHRLHIDEVRLKLASGGFWTFSLEDAYQWVIPR